MDLPRMSTDAHGFEILTSDFRPLPSEFLLFALLYALCSLPLAFGF